MIPGATTKTVTTTTRAIPTRTRPGGRRARRGESRPARRASRASVGRGDGRRARVRRTRPRGVGCAPRPGAMTHPSTVGARAGGARRMMTGLGRQRSAGAATAASEKKPRVANQSALSACGELGSRRANEIVRVSVRDRARGAPESAADTAGNEEDSVESPGGFAPRPPAASRTTEAPARSRTSALAPRVDATMAARTSVTVAATSALHAPRVRATARARRPNRTPRALNDESQPRAARRGRPDPVPTLPIPSR